MQQISKIRNCDILRKKTDAIHLFIFLLASLDKEICVSQEIGHLTCPLLVNI